MHIFFHALCKSDLAAIKFSCIDTTKGFVFNDGTRGIFPFLQNKGRNFTGFFSDYFSGYPYAYSGSIVNQGLSQKLQGEIIESIGIVLKDRKRKIWKI